MNDTNLWEGYQEQGGVLCKPDKRIETTAFSEKMADMLFRIEDNSWWFQYRVEVISRLAEKYLSKEQEVFDIGGGNGYTSVYLQRQNWKMVLLEPSFAECRNAKKRGVEKVVCNVLNPSDFPAESITQAVLLDVLEHIEDDKCMLRQLYSSLCKGGGIILTVPAYRCLWSSEDDAAGHFRRYRRGEIVQCMVDAGFHVEYSTYIFSFLWLPILILRAYAEKIGLLKRASERSEDERKKIQDKQFQHPGCIADWILGRLEKLEETRILAGKDMPFGSSVLIVARK